MYREKEEQQQGRNNKKKNGGIMQQLNTRNPIVDAEGLGSPVRRRIGLSDRMSGARASFLVVPAADGQR